MSRQNAPDFDLKDGGPPELLIIGTDISEKEVMALNVPIRPGPNIEKYIWVDEIEPQ